MLFLIKKSWTFVHHWVSPSSLCFYHTEPYNIEYPLRWSLGSLPCGEIPLKSKRKIAEVTVAIYLIVATSGPCLVSLLTRPARCWGNRIIAFYFQVLDGSCHKRYHEKISNTMLVRYCKLWGRHPVEDRYIITHLLALECLEIWWLITLLVLGFFLDAVQTVIHFVLLGFLVFECIPFSLTMYSSISLAVPLETL